MIRLVKIHRNIVIFIGFLIHWIKGLFEVYCERSVLCRDVFAPNGAIPSQPKIRLFPAANVHPQRADRGAVLGVVLDSRRRRARSHFTGRHHRPHHDHAAHRLEGRDTQSFLPEGHRRLDGRVHDLRLQCHHRIRHRQRVQSGAQIQVWAAQRPERRRGAAGKSEERKIENGRIGGRRRRIFKIGERREFFGNVVHNLESILCCSFLW